MTPPREDLDATIRTVTTLLPTIDGADAEGYLADLGDLLRAVSGLARVQVRKTGDPQRRFEGEARLVAPASAAAEALAAAWRRMAYPDEAHHLRVEEDAVVLDFVTWLPDRWHVTGRVTAAK